MMANAICLRIAAAPSAFDAMPLGTAIERNDWTGASRTDRDGLGETISGGHSVRHRVGSACPSPIQRPDHLRNSFTHTTEYCASLRPPRALASGSSLTRLEPVQVGLEPASRSRDRHRVSRTEQQSRSLSYLSLTLWCVAPRSGWLGSCASPHQRQSEVQCDWHEKAGPIPTGSVAGKQDLSCV